MEEKMNKKVKVLTFLFILSLFVIGVMGYFTYKFYNDKNEESKNVVELNSQVDSLKDKVDSFEQKISSMPVSSSGSASEESKSKNPEMTLELAYGLLNKYKSEHLADAKWYITNVELIAHGDNNTYWVSYDDINYSDGEPYEESLGVFLEYKNGKWILDLPGFSGITEDYVAKYNFKRYSEE